MQRKLTHQFDFGDVESIGAQLKKVDHNFNVNRSGDFGVYRGYCHDRKQFTIGVYDNISYEISHAVYYDDLEKLKKEWGLD